MPFCCAVHFKLTASMTRWKSTLLLLAPLANVVLHILTSSFPEPRQDLRERTKADLLLGAIETFRLYLVAPFPSTVAIHSGTVVAYLFHTIPKDSQNCEGLMVNTGPKLSFFWRGGGTDTFGEGLRCTIPRKRCNQFKPIWGKYFSHCSWGVHTNRQTSFFFVNNRVTVWDERTLLLAPAPSISNPRS